MPLGQFQQGEDVVVWGEVGGRRVARPAHLVELRGGAGPQQEATLRVDGTEHDVRLRMVDAGTGDAAIAQLERLGMQDGFPWTEVWSRQRLRREPDNGGPELARLAARDTGKPPKEWRPTHTIHGGDGAHWSVMAVNGSLFTETDWTRGARVPEWMVDGEGRLLQRNEDDAFALPPPTVTNPSATYRLRWLAFDVPIDNTARSAKFPGLTEQQERRWRSAVTDPEDPELADGIIATALDVWNRSTPKVTDKRLQELIRAELADGLLPPRKAAMGMRDHPANAEAHALVDLLRATNPERQRPVKTNGPKIARILSIVDTREYEVVEGRLGNEYGRPIPGSGQEHFCDRCGRLHEVWATVELTDGTQRVLGTGCAALEDPEQAGYFRRAEAAAKRLCKLQLEEAQVTALMEAESVIWHAVEALPPPVEVKVAAGEQVPPGGLQVVDEERRWMLTTDAGTIWRYKPMGEEATKHRVAQERDKAIAEAIEHWRENQRRQRGRKTDRWIREQQLEEIRRGIERARKSIEQFNAPKGEKPGRKRRR